MGEAASRGHRSDTAKPAGGKARGGASEPRYTAWLVIFGRNRMALTGLVLVLLFLTLAIFAPWLAPYDSQAQDLSSTVRPPSLAHPFGTDDVGRDILSRIMLGARTSFLIAVMAVGIGLLAGVSIGLTSGYCGGTTDLFVMRIVEVLQTIPTIVLAIAIVSVLQTGIVSVMIAVGVTGIPVYARLTRGTTLGLKEMEYVSAARCLGAKAGRILWRHLLPNALAPIIVQTSLGAGQAILVAAALSFLGLGVQPPTPEWGAMLSRGRTYVTFAPHLVAFPGLAIAALVLGFNLLGDGLRDTIDPRTRRLTEKGI
jgi:peptide/nickel transport system permease protein